MSARSSGRSSIALGFTDQMGRGCGVQSAPDICVAEHPGRGPKILLIGHLDTVFEPDSPFQKFQRIDEKTASGPGIIDMKGGDVIILSALGGAQGRWRARRDERHRRHDRRRGGGGQAADRLARHAGGRRARALTSRLASKTVLRIRNMPSRRAGGTTAWNFDVTGTAAHSSQVFRADIGPGRDLRGGAHSQRVSREARRRGAPDLQSGRDPRRHRRRFRRGAGRRNGVRQDQRHRRARGGDRRSARLVAGAGRSRRGKRWKTSSRPGCRTRRRR